MNFLSLTQAVKRESGLPGGGPVSYTSATGDDLRMFNWVNWAARDITLQRADWRWRRGAATLASTTSNTLTATDFALTNFATWKPANAVYKPSAYRVTDGASMEHELQWLDYDQFRKQFVLGTQVAGGCQYWSVSPAEELLLGPAPDTAHFVRADYIKSFVDLAADADIPVIPDRFHMLIVWRALKEYGGFDAASEVYQRADQNYTAMWPQLTQSQLEAPSFMARTLS